MSKLKDAQSFEQWRNEYNAQSRHSLMQREAGEGGITRQQLRAEGYVAAGRYSDLLEHGYQIVAWVSPRLLDLGQPAVIYEYCPVNHGKQRFRLRRPQVRMTARTLEEQLAAHAAIGVASQLELSL